MLGHSALSEVALGELPGGFVAPRTLVSAATRARWGAAQARLVRMRAVMPPNETRDARTGSEWTEGVGRDAQDRVPWGVSTGVAFARRAPWAGFTSRPSHENQAGWIRGATADDAARAPWGRFGAPVLPQFLSPWVRSRTMDDAAHAPWGGPMLRLEVLRDMVFPAAAPRDLVRWIPWVRFSRTIHTGIGVVIPPDDGVPEVLVVVPVRSVYMQVNSTFLRRVSDSALIPTFNMSMSLDVNSWVWSFSASLPAAAMTYVEPVDGEPVELEASVNGEPFRLLVERITRERAFGRAGISISGRGKIALLDAPYAPELAFTHASPRTVQQLIGDVLTDNGVPLGYDVEFGLTDWLVPAGVFSHRGSYMSAINRIAAAGGGYVQPHPTLPALSILPKYPHMPADWATAVDPDFELPTAPVTRESIEWADKPRYNRVFVTGVQQGVLGRVTRAGTAGDMVAQTITEALITHADAARQRGIPVLADGGRIATVGLRLPVLDATGIITPGKFVRYVDGATTRIGIVRAVNLEVANPQVWQTIKLETHHEPV